MSKHFLFAALVTHFFVLSACQTTNLRSFDALKGGHQLIPVEAHEFYPAINRQSFSKAIVEARHGEKLEVNASQAFMVEVLSAIPSGKDVKSISLEKFIAECDYTRPILPTYACRGIYKIAFESGDGNSTAIEGQAEKDFGVIIGDSWLNNAKSFSEILGKDFLERSALFLEELPKRPDGINIGQSNVTGSGFFISQNVLISNFHVINGCRNYLVKQRENSWDAQVIEHDIEFDLAALRVDRKNDDIVSISKKQLSKGTEVFVSGYPLPSVLSQEMKFTSGVVSATSGFRGSLTEFQISAPVQSGNSGGPVLNRAGELVGIVVSGLSARAYLVGGEELPQNVNFAIKNSVLKKFVKISGLEHTASENAPNKSAVDIAQLAENFTGQVVCLR